MSTIWSFRRCRGLFGNGERAVYSQIIKLGWLRLRLSVALDILTVALQRLRLSVALIGCAPLNRKGFEALLYSKGLTLLVFKNKPCRPT